MLSVYSASAKILIFYCIVWLVGCFVCYLIIWLLQLLFFFCLVGIWITFYMLCFFFLIILLVLLMFSIEAWGGWLVGKEQLLIKRNTLDYRRNTYLVGMHDRHGSCVRSVAPDHRGLHMLALDQAYPVYIARFDFLFIYVNI